MMSVYEEAELERRDLVCEQCGCIISTQEYLSNDGLCDKCTMIAEMHTDDTVV